ncbi:non-ribosomal peptide synthetase [Rhodococcoides yunnanense]|uniref:non-ribosomal peptide synthetase n=1 Tax=Rhodococcoides yunnanense TaxID=278209 RepID=UPI0009FE57C4|nr:non-ribosomal peptide synthetase [Rhodococcus yunnanensis]
MSASESRSRAAGATRGPSRRSRGERPTRRHGVRTELLPQLLTSAVETAGDSIALTSAGTSLSYRELDERSSQLARMLIERGVGPGDRVALALPRSIESVLAVWAVAKSGAAFVPVDPNYPSDRIEHMVSDSGAVLGLTLAVHVGGLPGLLDWLALDDPREAVAVASRPTHPISYADRVRPLLESHAAYIIYTSGSTGKPKGVVVTHSGLGPLVAAERPHFGLAADSRMLHVCSPSFDVSVLELLLAFTSGATLVVSPPSITGGQEMADLLRSERVTHVLITPGALGSIDPSDLPDLGVVVVAGDTFTSELVNRWVRADRGVGRPKRLFYNGYGPTEATILATSTVPLGEDEPPVIGTPIAGLGAFVLDTRLRPVPAGVSGELYLSGPQLAEGYNDRAALTSERFVANPFAESTNGHTPPGSGARLYRTGDVVRRDADGIIHYLGRSDFQVKIRGFRIELGEIDSALAGHPHVQFAATVGHELPSGDMTLVSYVLPRDGADLDTDEIVEHLGRTLPVHMIPAQIIELDSVPLTPVGKLDRAALPDPIFAAGEYVAPVTELERTVAEIYAEVLGIDRVGRTDSFLDLGGNSLAAARLVARLGAALDIRIPVPLLFGNPAVGDLAREISSRSFGDAHAALTPRVRPERIPLSLAQQRMWFLNRLDVGSAVNNIPVAIRLTGNLDTAALGQSIRDVVERHESLRTSYPDVDGIGYQSIRTVDDVLSELTADVVDPADVARTVMETVSVGFDVTTEVPLRVRLLKVAQDEHVLVFVVHHISGDGVSMGPLTRDVMAAYLARTSGSEPEFAPLPVQYADYTLWQREVLGSELEQDSVIADQIEYWTTALADLPAELALPTDRPRPAAASNVGATHTFTIDADVHRQLASLATATGASVFMVVHAALAVLLSRLSDSTDIAVGTPVAGRGEEALDNLIGMFVNTLVLRTDTSPHLAFRELLEAARDVDLEAFAHADLPFERLVEILDPERSAARHPIFQVMLTFQNMEPSRFTLPGLTVTGVDLDVATAKFDLQLAVTELPSDSAAEGPLLAELTYARDLFDEDTALGFGRRLTAIIDAIVADPDVVIGDIDIVDASERAVLSAASTESVEAGVATLVARFDSVVLANPDAPAVTSGDLTLTYAELDRRANRIARALSATGVSPESLVAVALPRSADLIAALLGVLKVGAGYLPIDTSNPADRISYILGDAAPSALITSSAELDSIGEFECPALDVDSAEVTERDGSPLGDSELPSSSSADNVAYVIYTSGSTGLPKGVAVTHRNVATLFAAAAQRFDFGSDDVWTMFHSYAFDFSVWEIWGPLLTGGRLVTVDYYTSRSPEQFLELLARERVTVLNQTPSAFAQLAEAERSAGERAPGLSLRYIVFGGEALDLGSLERWYARHPDGPLLVNMYGITETTVHVSYLALSRALARRATASVIGTALPGLSVRVLDSRLGLAPVGVAGELYVSGDQLARGYLGKPGLTATRFLADPFGPSGSVMYRTGDRGRWNVGGQLEYAGRSDLQVQLRGFRIELGEVESALLRDSDVAQVVALVRRDLRQGVEARAAESLVAYVVPSAGATIDVGRLRSAAAQFLTSYMVPDLIEVLDELPLTINGKLDTRALPVPVYASGSPFREPSTLAEKAVAEVFATVLSHAAVGADDSFFELGGNSLDATRVIARLNAALGSDVSVRELFEAPTVAALAACASAHLGVGGRRRLVAAERPSRIPLSLAQQRMWFLNRLDPGSSVYNIPLAIRLSGQLDLHALDHAIRDVIGRHESLRTSYPSDEEGPYQQVRDVSDVGLELAPFECANETELIDRVRETIGRGFDVSTDVPIRVGLFALSETDHVLAVSVHHISADGVSMAPLARDVMTAYVARTSGSAPAWAPLPVQYADFALWQHDVLGDAEDADSRAAGQLRYWTEQLRGVPDELDLSTDRPRPAQQSMRGRSWSTAVTPELTESLNDIARANNASLFMVVHSALAILLARISGGRDIAIGTAVAGRGDAALDGLVGMFVNTLALRVDVDPADRFDELLGRVRSVDLDAFANADVPFERVVDAVSTTRSVARHPIFQVVLSLQNQEQAALELPGLSVSVLDGTELAAKFDLQITVEQAGDRLRVTFTYATDLFDEQSIERLGERFEMVLDAITRGADVIVGDIDVQSDSDADQGHVLTASPRDDIAAVAVVEGATLGQVLRTVVDDDPDAPAVTVDEIDVSFGEVDERSSRLARELIARGIGPGDAVVVAIPRSVERIVTLWAVVKSGAAVAFGAVAVGGTETVSPAAAWGVAATQDSVDRSADEWIVLGDDTVAKSVAERSPRPVSYSERVRLLRPEDPFAFVDDSDSPLSHGDVVSMAETLRTLIGLTYESRTYGNADLGTGWSAMEFVLAASTGAAMVTTAAEIDEPEVVIAEHWVTHAFVSRAEAETLQGGVEVEDLIAVVRVDHPVDTSLPESDSSGGWTVYG